MNTASLINKPDTIKTPLPENISIQKDGRVINKDGWKFPSTQGLKMGEPDFVDMKSVDGKSFKVKKNVFIAKANTFFTVDGFDESFTILSGQLDLSALREFSINGKTFMYNIAVMKVGENNGQSSNTPGINTEFQLIDTDGDGKFETYTGKSAEEIPIPKWAAE